MQSAPEAHSSPPARRRLDIVCAHLNARRAILGKLPTPEEYLKYARDLDSMSDEIYRYMNFDQIVEFQKSADEGKRIAAVEIQEMTA